MDDSPTRSKDLLTRLDEACDLAAELAKKVRAQLLRVEQDRMPNRSAEGQPNEPEGQT